MIIKSYSDTSAFTNGGIWAPNATNFPDLAHFFKCDEATHGSLSSLVDTITATVATNSGGHTKNADGTLTLSAAITAFTNTNPGTKNVVLIYGGIPSNASSSIRFGTITSTAVRGFTCPNVTAGTASAVGDGGAAVIATSGDCLAGNGSNWQVKATVVEWGSATGLRNYGYDATTGNWTTAATPGDLTGHTGITASVGLGTVVSWGASSRPAFVQVWHFTTLPSNTEIQAACTWTLANVITDATRKWAYPGWSVNT